MNMIEKLYNFLNTRNLSGITPVLKPLGAYATMSKVNDCSVCDFCIDPSTLCDCYDPCGNHCECSSD